ncbi:MAG: LD-carboxypeptidase [Myxococcota bacterium]
MVKPLTAGDRIRIVAPSGAFDRVKFDAGVALIREAGFEPVFDPRIFERHRYLAGNDETRLAGVLEALADEHAGAIWTARGGYGATRIVDRIRPGSNAPWLIGFSDTTAVHSAWARLSLPSIHGANVTTLPDWGAAARQELFALLKGDTRQRFVGDAARSGSATGLLSGGNLTVLASMCGTGCLPNYRDRIVVLEDVGEVPYRIDRSLSQLLRGGGLAEAAGFVIGQLTRCGETSLEVIVEVLSAVGKPILTGLPFGHDPDSRAVVLGAWAEIAGNVLSVDLDAGRAGVV